MYNNDKFFTCVKFYTQGWLVNVKSFNLKEFDYSFCETIRNRTNRNVLKDSAQWIVQTYIAPFILRVHNNLQNQYMEIGQV